MFKLVVAALARFERATAALAQLDAATGQELGAYLPPQASAIEWIRHDQVRYLNAARKLAGDLGPESDRTAPDGPRRDARSR